MKFSYKLLKKIDPKIKERDKIINDLINHSFEVDEVLDNTLDISILPNRYNDASGHIGIARELAIASNRVLKYEFKTLEKKGKIDIEVEDNKYCSRYIGAVLSLESFKTTQYITDVLKDGGIKSINGIVDVMNYVMLLTGQPMHAFDYDKVVGGIKVKKINKKDKFITLDNIEIKIPSGTLVIADDEGVLAIAGVKGGKRAEVTEKTKKILVEAATFNQVSIFKTVKAINLKTDASLRFSHNLCSDLAERGMVEALDILKKEFKAEMVALKDLRFDKKIEKKILFSIERFEKFIGMSLLEKDILRVFELLDFKVNKKKEVFEILISKFRVDIETEEDLFEEVVRVVGINKVKPEAPIVSIGKSLFDETLLLKNKVSDILTGFSLDEVYTYSFNKDQGVELLNPISLDREFLRSRLTFNLEEVVKNNFRFFNEVNIFEIGRVFIEEKDKTFFEVYHLGIAVGNKKEGSFLFLRGVLEGLFRKLDLEFSFKQDKNKLIIYIDHKIIGLAYEKENISIAEINFCDLVKVATSRKSFKPIVKFPLVGRDISVLVSPDVRVGDMFSKIQKINLKEIVDIDMIDFYEGKKISDGVKSVTFRIMMQSNEKSITSKEVDIIINKIIKLLEQDFKGKVR
ncbi:MAG: phenylalanine--tRNA ligase subunit beta [Candidatus Liptonbacteria bacterium CG11_big_fil_rev_8_21_14_0_20_35_14]|uniref:phenylalanine--tRNA ligase n=1 Tax=Candidatus Liptonbacteria bacterium CG11_big_fil_rev_8_21_14_0_20_35_14 TaxID=1974634 RepID=A0A2H0NAQ2_9BACT|nr:MAG: phenylalanine--tRNA ligase subunit beta [Candidatus Liptonbacteria bacterium CG11_big_fil_rev_8_21_14_0_20_35_14]